MDQIIVRKATTEDIDTLLIFEQGVIKAERPYDPTLKPDPITYYDLTEMITAPHIELVIAVLNDEIIGSGYARIEPAKHFVKHSHHAYLGFMFTHPAHRGKGVNKEIIEVLKQWAISRDITEFRLEVYTENQSAIKAYEKVGFKGDLLQMRMGLTD